MDNYENTLARVVEAAESRPRPLNAGDLLDDVASYLCKFVAYPNEHSCVAHTLWVAHTHVMDAWESTPRLAFLSPEPGSGKTRALEITETLVPRPVEAVNVTPTYLFRKVGSDDGAPTILYDEIDTVFGPKAKDNEEIRGLLNAGHRRGAVAGRCVMRGATVCTEEISAYCAVALAGLGNLPDTILTRSIVVRMRRRSSSEKVQPFRRRVHAQEGERLRDRLSVWAEQAGSYLVDAWPKMPPGIEDRDADVWEPLLAIADYAGGDWPERARVAAVTHVTESKESTPSLGVRLLSDVREIFRDRESMFTRDILSALNDLEEAPWGNLRGQPLDARGLANRLRQYQIQRKQLRIAEEVGKGYARTDFVDAWDRYLPPEGCNSVTTVTEVTSGDFCATGVTDVTHVTGLTESVADDCSACGGEGCHWCDGLGR